MYTIKNLNNVNKEINIPPDKSISHRALIFSSLSKGTTTIKPFLISNDTLATLDCIKKCGVKFSLNKNGTLVVKGQGLFYPRKTKVNLYAGESGTTFRIFTGVLCGQKFSSYFDAHQLLRKRPMSRITGPLGLMGANIKAKKNNHIDYPPIIITPSEKLNGINYKMPIPSAQVKSAILLAALYSNETTIIKESYLSRDHTERMLSLFNAPIEIKNKTIVLNPIKKLISPKEIFIPSDFSSAAFFIVLGLISNNSEIVLKNINLTPSRAGLLKVLKRMGANIKVINKKNTFEPYGDLIVKSSKLLATTINKSEIPSMIDEIPILCVAASHAKGKTSILGVKELKVKETDRIDSTIYNLSKAGVNISAEKYIEKGNEDWLINIEECKNFKNAKFKSFSDHRTAMSAIVLGSTIGKKTILNETDCINKSFPNFIAFYNSLYKK